MIETYRGYVNPWECDEMGHMNVQFYVAKSSDASFHLRAALDLSARLDGERGTTLVALEHHIRFHRELGVSDLVGVRTCTVTWGEKTGRIYQEMRNLLTNEIAATFVVDVGCMSLSTRKLVPWSASTRAKAEAILGTPPAEAASRGLKEGSAVRDASLAAADAARMFESNRTAVNAWECDTNAHMNARFYMARFSECQGHMWAHCGISRHEQRARGLVTATTEYRIAYLRELNAGELVVVRTKVVEAGDKTIRYRHWMFEGETGAPAASAEGIALLMDKTSRRPIAVPDDVRRNIASHS